MFPRQIKSCGIRQLVSYQLKTDLIHAGITVFTLLKAHWL